MQFRTRVGDWSLGELKAMTQGGTDAVVSDLDFLETLSGHQCLLVPPWVVRAGRNGGLARVTKIIYDLAGNIDKPAVLLQTVQALNRAEKRRIRFGGRFT